MKIITGTDVEKLLDNKANAITLLAPDNDAFDKIDDDDLKILMEDKEKASAVMKNHILSGTLYKYFFKFISKLISEELVFASCRDIVL